MKRFGMVTVVWWFMFLTASAGCGKVSLLRSPAESAARGEKAVETIRDDAGRLA